MDASLQVREGPKGRARNGRRHHNRPARDLGRFSHGHSGLAARVSGRQRRARTVEDHRHDARLVHLHLRAACAACRARTGRRRARGPAADPAVGARDVEGVDGAEVKTDGSLEELARQAVAGDRQALDGLVRRLQSDVYGLALRMLWNREDAEDATQEILVRVVTRLAQFDFRSRLKTWVFRIAVNFILDVKKSPVEHMHLTFQRFADDLVEDLSSDGPADSERSLLVEEVKIGCTFGMLQCLDRPHRLAYVLGEILDLSGPESAEALGISTDLFRKRL